MSNRLVTAVRIGLPVLLFLLVLALPALDRTFGIDKAPQPNDNRALAEWPDAPRDRVSLNAYPRAIEAWFNDHFGFRNQFIRWHNRWKKSLYKDVSGADVLIGRDGWMYYSGSYMVENLRGARPLDKATLATLRLALEARHRWLAARGIAYVFVVAPNKETIYPEHLPDWLQAGIATPSKLDRFYAYMREHSAVPVVDLRAALLEAKAQGPLYYRHDSHWNTYGAFVASRIIVDTLRAQKPAIPTPLSMNQITLAVGQGVPHAGDLARMVDQSGREDLMTEVVPTPPYRPLEIRKSPLPAGETWPSGTEPMHTLNALGQVNALIFHDSFGQIMYPVLGLNFGRTDYVFQYLWSRTGSVMTWDPQRVRQLNPDVVIDLMVERALYFLNPETIRNPDLSD